MRLGALLLALASVACTAAPTSEPPDAFEDLSLEPGAHLAEVDAWRAKRTSDLEKLDGWLTLTGLYWLAEGPNTIGTASDNNLVVEGSSGPELIGTFQRRGQEVRFEAAPGVEVLVDPVANGAAEPGAGSPSSVPAGGLLAYMPPLLMDEPEEPEESTGPDETGTTELDPTLAEVAEPSFVRPTLRWGTLSWFVIKRGDRIGVRLKDSANPLLSSFEGVPMFDVDPAHRYEGRFETYDPPGLIMIPTILGDLNETESPGAVVFEVEGETHRLDMWKDSDDPANFFTAFADLTNGDETYGGGKFIWVDAPDEQGRVVVDFNKSYNPPCVFTPYATCPLPPQQNRLDLAIRAGEKVFKAF